MSFNCCLGVAQDSKYLHNETLFSFTLFVSMSRPRSIYVVSMWSIFHFHLSFHLLFISFSLWLILQFQECRHTCVFAYVLDYVLIFLDDNVDKECKLLSSNKSSASGCCLAFAWIFVSFSLVLLIKVLLIKIACN